MADPIVRQPNVCPYCNGQWLDRHFCPAMPWGRTVPGPVVVTIPPAAPAPQVTFSQVTFNVRAAGEGDTAADKEDAGDG